MVAQVATYKRSPYAFLSRPPPPKKRPTQPLPSPPAVANAVPANSAPPAAASPSPRGKVYAWASHVHPGSPAPCSPFYRSPNSSRRPSFSRRRPSIGRSRASSTTSTQRSFSLTSPNIKDYKPDLATMGYTSVFVRLPKTPSTGLILAAADGKDVPLAPPKPPVPATTDVEKPLKSPGLLRSLRLRARSNSTKDAPTPSSPAKSSASALSNRSKSKKPKSKRKNYPPPPSLAAELAILQFTDGGKLDAHAARFMAGHAAAAAGTGPNGGVCVPLRSNGTLWWDKDEQLEYAPLIPSSKDVATVSPVWVRFSASATSPINEVMALLDLAKRESASTQDSAYVSRALSPLDPEKAFAGRPVPVRAAKTGSGGGKTRRPPVLCIPARARKGQPAGYLLVSPPLIPKTPGSPRARPTRKVSVGHAHAHAKKSGGWRKRRPAPLNLSAISAGSTCSSGTRAPIGNGNAKVDVETAKNEFAKAAFVPVPAETRMMEVKQRSTFEDDDDEDVVVTKANRINAFFRGKRV